MPLREESLHPPCLIHSQVEHHTRLLHLIFRDNPSIFPNRLLCKRQSTKRITSMIKVRTLSTRGTPEQKNTNTNTIRITLLRCCSITSVTTTFFCLFYDSSSHFSRLISQTSMLRLTVLQNIPLQILPTKHPVHILSSSLKHSKYSSNPIRVTTVHQFVSPSLSEATNGGNPQHAPNMEKNSELLGTVTLSAGQTTSHSGRCICLSLSSTVPVAFVEGSRCHRNKAWMGGSNTYRKTSFERHLPHDCPSL